MKTDPYLIKLQTAQYHAFKRLAQNYPDVFNMYKNLYKEITRDYTNKAYRCVRIEHEREFQELYAEEAQKRGIATNYARRKANIAKMRQALEALEADPMSTPTLRLI
jgi:septal ring factor EnvC (AmiA/AmiB activator)